MAAVVALALCAPALAEHVSRVPSICRLDGARLTPKAIDGAVARLMARGQVPGLALALIQDGQPVHVEAYGFRNVEDKLPLQTNTVMYGASLTKLAFAYMVLQLVDENVLDLDRPVATYLAKPLPEYPKYATSPPTPVGSRSPRACCCPTRRGFRTSAS